VNVLELPRVLALVERDLEAMTLQRLGDAEAIKNYFTLHGCAGGLVSETEPFFRLWIVLGLPQVSIAGASTLKLKLRRFPPILQTPISRRWLAVAGAEFHASLEKYIILLSFFKIFLELIAE
jgi:nitrate reductase gamma subunit